MASAWETLQPLPGTVGGACAAVVGKRILCGNGSATVRGNFVYFELDKSY